MNLRGGRGTGPGGGGGVAWEGGVAFLNEKKKKRKIH